jgi:superfamily I DNA/RNA helicase
MPWDDDLNGVYLEIAGDPSSPLHVLAGPGTGKTFAMMRRVARLLESGTRPAKILTVTFTRTAARDLTEQLNRLGVEGAERVRASTLHSLCYSILRQQAVFEATGRVARPLLSHELEQLINDLAGRFGGKRRVKELIEAYEAGWARLQRDVAGVAGDQEDQEFEAALIDWLRYHRSVLIGELVPLTLSHVHQNPASEVLPQFDHVLVDEYQDLNQADQALVVELARSGTITVIGDDNQSIYGFRYANPEGIRTFPEEHQDVTCYTIEQCFRCPPNIVTMSNALIRNNPPPSRVLPLRSVEGLPPAEMCIVQHASVDIETVAIADYINSYLERHPDLSPGQVLVLTTRRFIGHEIRRELIHRGRNALSYFFEDELESTSAAEGFCLLNLLVNPNDRAALRAWIGLGQTSNGFAPGYTRVRGHAQGNELELRHCLDQLCDGVVNLPYSGRIVDRCENLRERFAELDGLSGLDLVRVLWPPVDSDSDDIRLLAENLAVENSEPPALYEALLREITQPELPGSDSDIIRVMSLHKSKGLTATLVVVAGCVSGALPTIDSRAPAAVQDAQLEEQRRLFYVSVTRATGNLVVSSSVRMPSSLARSNGIDIGSHYRDGGTLMAMTFASPFIRELGPAAPRTINTQQWRQQAGF